MTLESIRATIDSDRAVSEPLRERVTSPYLKRQCQQALYYLDDCEYFYFRGEPKADLYFAGVMLKLSENPRAFVEDCVRKWGYDAVAIPYDSNKRTLSLLPLLFRLTDFLLWRLSLEPFGQRFVLPVLSLRGDQIRVVMFQSLHQQGGFVVRDRGHDFILFRYCVRRGHYVLHDPDSPENLDRLACCVCAGYRFKRCNHHQHLGGNETKRPPGPTASERTL